MAEVDVGDRGTDLEPRRRLRDGLCIGERVVERLGDEDRLVAQLLGPPGPGDDVPGGRVAHGGEREGEPIRAVHAPQ